jgi:uncharacterized protein
MSVELPHVGCHGNILCQPSRIHGRGLFSGHAIPAGQRIIEYVGEIVSKAESLRRCEQGNECIFALDEEHDLDGNVPWNPARFLNHSCTPNCEANLDEGQIWIAARRDIAAGEELTFNYGYDLVDYREHPCHCGARECVGYMVAEEFFEHLRRQRFVAADVRRL